MNGRSAIPKGQPDVRRRLAAVPDGSPDFEAMFRREYRPMLALAASVSGSRAHAEDIVQEAMTRLDNEWTTISSYAKPGAWLRRVTINLAISEKRRTTSERRARRRLGPPEPELPSELPAHQFIWSHVAKLSPMQRAVVSLHYLEDQTPSEIADILDISPATARVHLHRARRALHLALTNPAAPSEDQR